MKTINSSTDGISFPRGGFKNGELVMYAGNPSSGKSTLYNKNLCQEIMLTGQQTMMTLLTSLNIPGYPNTTSSLNRLMPKYKFSRAKWYVADFDWSNELEVFDWCVKQFGPHPERPDAWSRWEHKYDEQIHFRDEKDYAWFMLRWS